MEKNNTFAPRPYVYCCPVFNRVSHPTTWIFDPPTRVFYPLARTKPTLEGSWQPPQRWRVENPRWEIRKFMLGDNQPPPNAGFLFPGGQEPHDGGWNPPTRVFCPPGGRKPTLGGSKKHVGGATWASPPDAGILPPTPQDFGK